MSEDNKHNGWTNYETWTIHIRIENDKRLDDYWHEEAKRNVEEASRWERLAEEVKEEASLNLARILEEDHLEGVPDLSEPYDTLLAASFSKINWYEIARYLIERHLPNQSELLEGEEKENV